MNIDNKISIVIADDHEMVRDGLRVLLESDHQMKLLAEAADGQQLVDMVRKHRPDVVVTDLRMPVIDGIDAIKLMLNEGVDRILAFTMADSACLLVEALEAGALGCVVKNAPRAEILEGIRAVYRHKDYFCRSSSDMMARQFVQLRNNSQVRAGKDLFNKKEKEIIRMVCMGKSSEDIGEIFFMSARTVEGVRSRIWQKMQVKSQAEFIVYAIKYGIYEVNKEEDFLISE